MRPIRTKWVAIDVARESMGKDLTKYREWTLGVIFFCRAQNHHSRHADCLVVSKMSAVLADVETEVLYGEIDEEIYMKTLQGFGPKEDECLLLVKAVYGLDQASRQWRWILIAILKKCFRVSEVDPCLM